MTPRAQDFEIDPEASDRNKITKEILLSKPIEKRPYFDEVWNQFLDWIKKNVINFEERVVL